MELNLWTEDFFLPQDVGLDLLADPKDGQYDDIRDKGHLSGDWKHVQYEDEIEQLSALSSPSSLDEMGWMESDIGSFLEDLASHQQDLSFSSELFDVPSSSLADSTSQSYLAVSNGISETNNYLTVEQDYVLTPPESPGQVNPVTILSEVKFEDISPSSPPKDLDFIFTNNNVIFQDELGVNSISITLPPESQDSVHFLGSPLSVNEVDSVLSISEPASPVSPNTSSFILSSPELYKVIAAPSNISNRFAPYCKQKPEQKSKSPKSSKAKKCKLELELEEEEHVLDLPEGSCHLVKKDRKRVQNKNAAIRYRQKKKEEAKYIYSEVSDLEETNQDLKSKVEDLEREIKYMTDLMKDIQRAKRL